MPANPVIQNHFTCDGCEVAGLSVYDPRLEAGSQILPEDWLALTVHWKRNAANSRRYGNKQKPDKSIALCGECARRVCDACDKPTTTVPPPAPPHHDINSIAFENPA